MIVHLHDPIIYQIKRDSDHCHKYIAILHRDNYICVRMEFIFIISFTFFIFSEFLPTESAQICKNLDQYCNCDYQCMRYGDCCPGHKWFNRPGSWKDILSCKRLGPSPLKKVWVVDKCTNNIIYWRYFGTDVPIRNLPVISAAKVVYRTDLLARCNGEKTYEYLNISIRCTHGNYSTIEAANLWMRIYPCSIDLTGGRECFDDLVRNCPYSDIHLGRNVSEMCEYGEMDLVKHGGSYYRNEYCCQCWNVSCGSVERNGTHKSKYNTDQTFFNEWSFDSLLHSMDPYMVLLYNTSTPFLIISTISLSFLIFLYTTEGSLRHFNGYMTVCLSGCLFFVNILEFLPSKHLYTFPSLCIYVTIFQKFVLISTLFWMAVYTFNLLQIMFIESGNEIEQKSMKIFCIHCAIVFGCVTLYVGTLTVLDVIYTRRLHETKRLSMYCYPNGIAWLLSYFVPVCLALLWNVCICMVVIYKLIKTFSKYTIVQQSKRTSTAWLCVKLTAITGLGFSHKIFALVNYDPQTLFIVYLSYCLQGFFLTIAFLWSKRVRKLISTKVSSLKDRLIRFSNISMPQTQVQYLAIPIALEDKS